ncbi:MAG TPA: 50S ribosomal protein L32 [Planctomycetes bacterium]|nr:50S ribosomal protein L32 [Planctomycetota bacterium]HIN80382.1 50S ribosomal protein L32 [Planctomycetota bacterium]
MAVPKRKTSRARKLKRRAHDGLTEAQRCRCTRCGDWTLPHSVCENCGHYRGRALLPVEGF